ncbi:MAG: tagaturonate epimerase family protein, partial [Melioribacteraceae bacterium]|nr:tagaturonate epimerase family protein [Melioribacteraceae bacterium]
MFLEKLNNMVVNSLSNDSNSLVNINSLVNSELSIYPKSVNTFNNLTFFIGKVNYEKYLFVVSTSGDVKTLDEFEGKILDISDDSISLKQCPQIHSNAVIIKRIFAYLNPILLGLNNSFGFGDRIGLANPAHLRSLKESEFKPILAQQSIRELTRTNRTPDEVMDAAVWAVFQEGYKKGFGSDADHLKTTDDIDLMMKAGFTMLTFDPSEFVINEADSLEISELEKKKETLNWNKLDDSFVNLNERYKNVEFDLKEGLVIKANYEEILRATVKYGNAVAHIKSLNDHLISNYQNQPYEVEISVDETESVTTPFEHFFMASELNRLGVKIVSLAPRFIGDFEKGIDYKGDIELFKKEYLKHVKISEYFGSYKISLHSGSDKFGVYKAIGQLKRGYTHVKTAGTSYLEALKVVAYAEPKEFRKILDFARIEYEKEKESYHVSAELKNVHSSEKYTDEQLLELFNQNDARQVLHVTFGRVLTIKDENGKHLFKDIIY